jgi:hypothetical protein
MLASQQGPRALQDFDIFIIFYLCLFGICFPCILAVWAHEDRCGWWLVSGVQADSIPMARDFEAGHAGRANQILSGEADLRRKEQAKANLTQRRNR